MLEGRPVCVVGSELLGTLLEGRELGDELLGLLDGRELLGDELLGNDVG
jgi:hypothetical protein